MIINRKNDNEIIHEEDTYEPVKHLNLTGFKLPLIILGVILIFGLIIFLIVKLINREPVVYQEKLYYITLEGEPSITLYQGDIYNEPGYSAKDDSGKDVTNEVVITDSVNTDKIGEYKISYTIGNITKERIIKVIEKPIGATYIHLYGDINTYLYIGEDYQEKGYEVIDTVDSNLKDKVKIDSNVDTSKEGIYKVIYSVTNSSNVTTSKERTVIVMDRSLSLIPDITDMTNKNITININIKDELFDYLILPNNIKISDRMSTYEVNSNGTYKFVMYNKKGESKEKEIEITNIDKEAPTGSCSGYTQDNNSYINISTDDTNDVSKYVINGNTYTSRNIVINSVLSSVTVTMYDKAGNNTAISCTLENKNPTTTKPAPSSSSSNENNVVPLDAPTGLKLKTYSGSKYYEYIPEGATTNMPLVIYLEGGNPHNAFAKSVENFKKGVPTKHVLNGTAYKYQKFIFMWPDYSADNTSSFKEVKKMIDHVVAERSINKDKIIITGVSNGAVATFWLAVNYPGYFSAVVPLCGPAYGYTVLPNDYLNRVDAYKDVSLWSMTAGRGDFGNYEYKSKQLIQKIKKAYPNATALYACKKDEFASVLTSQLGRKPAYVPNISSYRHCTIMEYYSVPELWEWMLKQ